MNNNKRAHSVGIALVLVLLVIGIFSIGFYTEGTEGITGATIYKATGPGKTETTATKKETTVTNEDPVAKIKATLPTGTYFDILKDPKAEYDSKTGNLVAARVVIYDSDDEETAKEIRTVQFLPSDASGGLRYEEVQSNGVFSYLDAAFRFQGLGFYSKFFFEEEDLNAWREYVDKQFATYYLGTEYWESAICSQYVDRSQEGIAYFDTKIGLSGIAAHIEATRSEAIGTPPGYEGFKENGTQDESEYGIVYEEGLYLYKITFNVKNGDYDTDPAGLAMMRFNVILRGAKEKYLYSQEIELERGKTFGAVGSGAIVQYSRNFYDTICIQFDVVPSKWTLDNNEICNTIGLAYGEPTAYVPKETNSSGSGSGGSSGTVIQI